MPVPPLAGLLLELVEEEVLLVVAPSAGLVASAEAVFAAGAS